MGSDRRFWLLFGGIFLVVGICFIAASLGINLFADPNGLNGAPPWVFALAGLAAGTFSAFILRRTLLASARERRLIQTGIQVHATVSDVRRSLVEINRQSRWYVCYSYNYAGRAFTGESNPMPGEMVMEFKPGDRITIKVDPRKPEDSLFVGRT